jgi:hypothetical protein
MSISLGQMPLEALDAYLSVVKGYTKTNDRAVDTKYVAGVESELIAKAATNEDGELVNDRETVQNALELNGKSADKYLLKEDSKSLLGDTYSVSTIISDELKALRDELYQTKAELAKLGLIKQGPVYNGFYDAFKNDNIRYNNEIITTLAQTNNESGTISTITVEDASAFVVGEYIAIKTSKETQVAKITSISNSRIDITPAIAGPLGNETKIYKTAGTYNRGMFVFGEKTGAYASSDVFKVVVKDGKRRQIIKTLNTPFTGYASRCNNLYSIDGALNKIQVSLACDGNPGIIRAYLYKVTDNTDPAANNELIAESDTISAAQVSGVLNNYTFNFEDTIKLSRNNEYIVLLKTEYANESNRWYIGGFVDECTDDCVCCAGDTYDYISDAFQLTNEMSDMYIAFYMSDIIENEINYMQKGIYTCELEIPDKFTRVRTELRINREGLFTSADNNILVYNESNPLQLDGNEYSYATLFTTGQQIVGGTSVARVGSTVNSNNRFSLAENTYIPYGSDVYRVGYKVNAILKNKVINLNNPTNPVSYTDTKLVELPLVAVMKGKEPNKEATSSDRLIFEAEIGINDDVDVNILNQYNTLEIQIYWENSALPVSTINTNNDLAGKIYDLSISTDKSYNKKQ